MHTFTQLQMHTQTHSHTQIHTCIPPNIAIYKHTETHIKTYTYIHI